MCHLPSTPDASCGGAGALGAAAVGHLSDVQDDGAVGVDDRIGIDVEVRSGASRSMFGVRLTREPYALMAWAA